MRKPKVEESALLAGLMSVLRSKGYDGSSLNELAASSGLQKASLYHRFPGGKKEIAAAVLSYVNEWADQHIYALLCNDSLSPEDRLSQVFESIREVYGNGEEVCILRALSMDSGMQLFHDEIQAGIQKWIDGFTHFGKSLGFSNGIAHYKAVQVLTHIQGSLIVSKGVGNTQPFEIALKSIAALYKK